jgi:hypothetical protein
VKGDRRRTGNMPTFFKDKNILFASANYPLEESRETRLIDLQIAALKGLDAWLINSPEQEKYPEAFKRVTILSHSAGSHLVALADKLHGWNRNVKCLILMDSSAYDLQSRFRQARPYQQNIFGHLLGLSQRPLVEHDSILRSYSPALLPPRPREGDPLKVIIITSHRLGAYYSAEKLKKSYQAPGYEASVIQYAWEHEDFPNAVGVDQRLNELLLQVNQSR